MGMRAIPESAYRLNPAPPIEAAPIRQLSRLRSELSLMSNRLGVDLLPNERARLIEVGVVARTCLPDWVRGDDLRRPDSVGRVITIRQIALSRGAPRETIRRSVNRLIELGILAATPAGVALAATSTGEAFVRRYLLSVHDMLLRLVEDLAATSDIDLPVAPVATFTVGDVIARGLDSLLAPIDTFTMPTLSTVAFFLWAALSSVAVRRVTYDRALSRRFALEVPTDAHRRSVSLNRLAAALSLPYATAWRAAQQLLDERLVTRLPDDRLIITAADMNDDRVRDIGVAPSALVLRKVRELALLGLDSARAGGLYRIGRPEIVPI